jgi:hypothetical protein
MCAGALDRLSELIMADSKNYLQMKASTALCTGLADVLEVALTSAISSKGGALDAAAIDFLGAFCMFCTTDLLTKVLVSSHFYWLGNVCTCKYCILCRAQIATLRFRT